MADRQASGGDPFRAILDAARAITSSIEIDEVLARISREATLALDCSQAAVYDYHAETDTITYTALFEKVPSHGEDDSLQSIYRLDDYPGDRVLLLGRRAVVEQLSDPGLPDDRRESMEAYREFTTLNVPLWFDDQPLGILRLYEMEQPRRFTDAEIELAVGLGEQAAIAVHTARLVAANRQQRRQIEALLGIGHAVTAVPDAARRLETAAHLAADTLEASRASVFTYDPLTATLVASAFWSRDPAILDDERSALLEALASDFALRLNSAPAVQRARDESLDPGTRDEMRTCGQRVRLGVPLSLQDHRIGALVLDWTHDERRLTGDDLTIARGLGEHVALALAGVAPPDTGDVLSS
jgi:GAF domain-containing protein